MTKTLTAVLVATLTAGFASGSASAAGTDNGNAGCVARINTIEGPPGQSIETIKLFISPVPGALVSSVGHGDRSNCELP
jgi:hypothetical protein